MASGKTIILITGANGGIGLDTATALSTNPAYHVIIGSRSSEKGQKALRQIQLENPQANLSLIQLDITDDASIKAAASSIDKDFGSLAVLINNAGINSPASDLKQRMQQDFSTNIIGTTMVTEAFIPLLRSPSGRLIFVSTSLASLSRKIDPSRMEHGVQELSYRSSKAALNMVMAHYGAAYRKEGLKVFALCLGYVATDLSGNREERISWGLSSSREGVEIVVKTARGERDEFAGRWIDKEGVIEW